MELVERANSGLHSHVAERIVSVLENRNGRVLDLGCGTGALLARLSAKGYTSLHGVDIALPEKMLAGIAFSACDLDSGALPFEDDSLDLIVSVEVFEHVENMGTLIKEVGRTLTRDGVLIMTTPNVHSIEARLRYLLLGKLKQFDEIGDPTHVYPVFMHAFAKILARNSLEVVDAWGYPLDGSSQTSRRSLRVAARLLRVMGLTAAPPGDHLCMAIRRRLASSAANAMSKREVVASHY
jgi:2-polyprenyl-3-methyl-5-hydroxy-6-metoxy-1,4-benzoquinol methylase